MTKRSETKAMLMLKKLKKIIEKRKHRKLIVKSELQRKKIDFVYNFLLRNYEIQLKNTVDLPAFHYANNDMEQIIKLGKVNIAYDEALKAMRNSFEARKARA